MRMIVLLLLISKFSFSQSVEDRKVVQVNLKHQFQALTSLISDSTTFRRSIQTLPAHLSPLNDSISLKINSKNTDTFLLRSSIFPTEIVVKRYGEYRDTSFLVGKRTIEANKFYIINSSQTSLTIPIEDGAPILVQEAQDSLGNWRPIEYFYHSGCGFSYSTFIVGQNQFISMYLVKYHGDFETQLRVKMQINDEIYYSEPFLGSLNYGQFSFPENSSRINLFE